MSFPKTKAELETAGYGYAESRQCSARECLAPIELWWTPNGRKIPLNVGTLEPHFATCPAVKNFRKKEK